MTGIVFQVDTSRVLAILANEIYDSPLAMLRENLQNAYDAVRQRFAADGSLTEGGRILVTIEDRTISITDNGIGMTEEILRENFWKAGSSGKRSDNARKAGVVGTFGIGAMANFGVCSALQVVTRAIGQNKVLRSAAELASLQIGEECISFGAIESDHDFGTTITAIMDDQSAISEKQAIDYLRPYVRMLPVPVSLNGTLISGDKIDSFVDSRSFSPLATMAWTDKVVTATFATSVDPNAQALVHVTNIEIGGQRVDGSMILLQGSGQLMGLRSYFGLAPVPAAGHYRFGGFANLSFLHPTAGREALSRDSIEQVNRLIILAEYAASEAIGKSPLADRSNALLSWITPYNRYDLAKNVTIGSHPGSQIVTLGQLEAEIGGHNYLYYTGTASSIINTFANESCTVLQVSQNNPRRRVQTHYISEILKINPVPASAQIIKTYEAKELSLTEMAFLLKVGSTIRDDYLIPVVEVHFADISHSVTVLVEKIGETPRISISRTSAVIAPLLGVYKTAYELFDQFIKDYVRVNIYPSIQFYVPSSTKGGVEALHRLLLKNRELYRYEQSDQGEVEGILGEALVDEKSFELVIREVRFKRKPQTQRVSAEQVGRIETELPGIGETPLDFQPDPDVDDGGYDAAPPIIRDTVKSQMKILTTNEHYPLLNNFTMFLGLSDKLMNSEAEFFRRPHTTRIIWGGQRVVYIFTEETETLSLYYDIELKGQIQKSKTGGSMFPTTTIVTDGRVFIPIPDVLTENFQVGNTPKEFFVRFDILSGGMSEGAR
ncbi:ATP-binding protein [Rhizobium leguminosarum]|uniref:ATP-binding protein n=1 Tax=Rhizobium leguminosarum TaxID=384 RepID=UPI0015B80C8A|nr:ATP-binding protein [Rhizobium leguminosarum]